MYDKKSNCWVSNKYEKSTLAWCKDPKNKDNPKAIFILADTLLEQAANGKEISQAVYLMELAAKKEYSKAAFAMGQLFQYGWAVSLNKKTAVEWYKKAAKAGDKEASYILQKMKQQIILKFFVGIFAAILILAIGCGVVLNIPKVNKGIIVHDDTSLVEPTDLTDFSRALNNLILQYDDELVVSGQRGSNRLMFRFEGEGIDLSDFPAAVVISGYDNFLIVQFDNEKETQKCLETLKSMQKINFVEEDGYETSLNEAVTREDLKSKGVPYNSPYTGYSYYSWGVEYLGLDRLAAWISTQNTDTVTVAVIDTGSEPCSENANMYLEGFDIVNTDNGNSWYDPVGHGTHVAGTVIDCMRGLDVKILPIRVMDDKGTSADSTITIGLQRAILSDVDVINMSLGGKCSKTEQNDYCGNSKDYYIEQATKKGIVVVVSAGNGDNNGNPINTNIQCPAHCNAAIVVAACDINDDLACFSNYGDSVDVCAPGIDVVSYYPGGTLHSLSGTSMAAPHISALAAMLKMITPDKSTAQIEKYIADYCVDMGNSQTYGDGIPWAAYFAGN